MEVVRPTTRRARESESRSPDRAKVCMQQQPKVKPIIKKVQVVYYLSRNGQLEHPHYMEVTHFANQHLRLKDFMDRLTVLRGKGMPSLYSWSCKRSYKNGYVWNDLAENDIIHPSDGAEYVLKGSELVEGCSERLQHVHLSSNRQLIPEPNLHAKRKQLAPSQSRQLEETHNNKKYEYDQEYLEQEEEEEEESSQEELEDEEKTSYTSSTTPRSRCSRGVSTDELEEPPTNKTPTMVITESAHPDSVPHKPSQNTAAAATNNTSKRFEDSDRESTESAPSRNSVLLQLISCGNLAAMTKTKNHNNLPNLKQEQEVIKVKMSDVAATKKKSAVASNERDNANLHRGILYKGAVNNVGEEDMIRYMSENPRFGNFQAEEKEYFSGSIVESRSESRVVDEPGLKRSNSYNAERNSKAGLEEAAKEKPEVKDRASKAKCIPLKICTSSSKQTKK